MSVARERYLRVAFLCSLMTFALLLLLPFIFVFIPGLFRSWLAFLRYSVWLSLAPAFFSGYFSFKAWRHKMPAGECPKCGYHIGIKNVRCPECGGTRTL